MIRDQFKVKKFENSIESLKTKKYKIYEDIMLKDLKYKFPQVNEDQMKGNKSTFD